MSQRRQAAVELQALKATYFRCLDGKDWQGMTFLFAPGATFTHPVLGPFDDIVGAIEAVAERIGTDRTVHKGQLLSLSRMPAGFSASFVMSSQRWMADRCVRTRGRYDDTFVSVDGRWRISSLNLVSSYREE